MYTYILKVSLARKYSHRGLFKIWFPGFPRGIGCKGKDCMEIKKLIVKKVDKKKVNEETTEVLVMANVNLYQRA